MAADPFDGKWLVIGRPNGQSGSRKRSSSDCIDQRKKESTHISCGGYFEERGFAIG